MMSKPWKDFLRHSDYHFFSSGKYGNCAHLVSAGQMLSLVLIPTSPIWHLPLASTPLHPTYWEQTQGDSQGCRCPPAAVLLNALVNGVSARPLGANSGMGEWLCMSLTMKSLQHPCIPKPLHFFLYVIPTSLNDSNHWNQGSSPPK